LLKWTVSAVLLVHVFEGVARCLSLPTSRLRL
jgi:hypothetical protein